MKLSNNGSRLGGPRAVANALLILVVVAAGAAGVARVESDAQKQFDQRFESGTRVAGNMLRTFLSEDLGGRDARTVELSDARIRSILEQTVRFEQSRAYVIDDAGRVLGSNWPDVERGSDLVDVDPDLAAALNPSGGRYESDGRTWQFVNEVIASPRWRFIVTTTQEEAAAPLRAASIFLRVQVIAFALSVGAALILAWGAMRLNRRLTEANTELAHLHRVNEESLESVQRMNEALDAFTRTAAHDLRSPLATMKMWVDLLESQAPDLGDIGTDAVQSIREGTERGMRLVNDLLEFARASADTPFERFDLGAAVTEAAEATGAEVHVDAPPREVVGDPIGVRQAVTNLITNAAKYAPGQPIQVDAHATDGHWTLTVTDSGPGVDPAIADDLFKPFVRGPETSSAQSTGLGLSIVATVAERHHGTVAYEKADGAGARFTVTCPTDPSNPDTD